ncbi:MAG: hypothetical protein IPQ07_16915 [Myxococcales bacterium]|nr:hypothetical protein [Myxococcales bacterium]
MRVLAVHHPGFAGGKGDRWTFPLAGPFEDGPLLTPVSFDGHGPYLFAIDPDANISAVDEQVIKEGQFRTFQGPHRLDESDTQQIRVLCGGCDRARIADRRASQRDDRGSAARTTGEGRWIHGVLGRTSSPILSCSASIVIRASGS